MKSYIQLEMTAIFFQANLYLRQGISSKYVMVDFIRSLKLGKLARDPVYVLFLFYNASSQTKNWWE